MSSYVRPSIDAPVFRDADGRVIEYGARWDGVPPEDSYPVDTHPERFAPLHAIADALIAHVRDAYDVDVVEGLEAAGDLLRPARDVVRAVRVQPRDAACAALTIVYTRYPGIVLHAGLLHDFHYPDCGCDACDSTWDTASDGLERQVHAVVTGHYRETIERGIRTWIAYRSTFPDGAWEGGRSRARDLPAARVTAAKSVLRDLADGWQPWPRRA